MNNKKKTSVNIYRLQMYISGYVGIVNIIGCLCKCEHLLSRFIYVSIEW